MFEASLLGLNEGAARRQKTWIALSSVVTQIAVLAALIVWPLVSPAKMPAFRPARLKSVSLSLEKPKPVVPKPVVVRTTNASIPTAPASASAASATRAATISRAASGPVLDQPPFLPYGPGMASTGGPLLTGLGPSGRGAGGPVIVASGVERKGPLTISQGVTAGLLLAPIRPIYPRIAVAAGVRGMVVVTATIDKSGRIVGLQVVSGPEMLRQAAADAVREARYRPYLLNGQATEVITTISVNFTMGG